MKTRRVSLMAMAITIVFAIASVTAAKAGLLFTDMDGTWWKTTKQMNTGYLFPPVTDGAVSKAKKFNYKDKPGYMYIPEASFDAVTSTYMGIILLDYDKTTQMWLISEYNFVVHGGTPNDFVAHSDGLVAPIEPGTVVTMALTVRAKLTENKKVPGTIKSGQVRTLGSALIIDVATVTFAGKQDFRAKWLPPFKVPAEVVNEAMNYVTPVVVVP